MAQQITYDKAYDAVGPEDFPAMLEVPRYGRRSNAFDGIISISVNPAYFESFYKTVTESASDSVALVRSDGLLLARVPGAPPVGERMLPRNTGGMMDLIATRPDHGLLSQRGAIDGIDRIYAYQRVGDYPLYATYGLSYATVWAEWWRNMLAYGLVCLTATILLIAAAVLVRRHDRREAETAARYLEESIRRRTAEDPGHGAASPGPRSGPAREARPGGRRDGPEHEAGGGRLRHAAQVPRRKRPHYVPCGGAGDAVS